MQAVWTEVEVVTLQQDFQTQYQSADALLALVGCVMACPRCPVHTDRIAKSD